jgi:hypothetical protein
MSKQIKLWTINHNHFLDKCLDVCKFLLRNLHTSAQKIDIGRTARVSAVLALLYSILFYSILFYSILLYYIIFQPIYITAQKSTETRLLTGGLTGFCAAQCNNCSSDMLYIQSRMTGGLNDGSQRNKKGPIRIPGPETEKKKLSRWNTNDTGVTATQPPRAVYQDKVISSNNIIVQEKAFNRTCLVLRNRKPHLRGSTDLYLVAATLNISVVITN